MKKLIEYSFGELFLVDEVGELSGVTSLMDEAIEVLIADCILKGMGHKKIVSYVDRQVTELFEIKKSQRLPA